MDAIITAAGKNSRMIADFEKNNRKPIHKLKLEINNKPIIVHSIDNLFKSNIENIIVCLGHYQEEILDVLDEYNLTKKILISINEDKNVGLSKTIENALKTNGTNKYYLYTAGDQPTISPETFNKMIDVLDNSPNKDRTISILARRKYGQLSSAEGLGMPFCCYGKLLYDYIIDENDNLNPILRKMIKDNVSFYGIKEKNKIELKNINHLEDYYFIKNEIERKK